MITKLSALIIGFFLATPCLHSQPLQVSPQAVPGPIIVCPAGPFTGVCHIHSPIKRHDPSIQKDLGEPCANIVVTYINFPANVQTAFQEAVDIWANALSSSVTIRIEASWTNLGAGVLGSAGPAFLYHNFTNSPDEAYYPVALANQIAGFDLAPSQPDIIVNINSNFTWYLGTDGENPFNQYDLVTVVLHELGHGLGFISSGEYTAGSGSIGIGNLNNPLVYDQYMILGQNGIDLLTIDQGTPLGDAFVSNNLYCSSTSATAANNGVQPKLYAPASFSAGSSLSHLDEFTFPSSNENALMTPQIGAGQSIHNPGPITLGLFEDIGWTLCSNDTLEPDICTVESLIVEGETILCPADVTTVNTAEIPLIPTGGGLGMYFFNLTTTEEIYVPDISLPYSFDSDLNGFLSGSGLDPLEGEYQVFAFVYSDSTDITNSICSLSPDIVVFNFLNLADSFCTPDPCESDLYPPVAVCQSISLSLDSNGIALLTPDQIDNGSVDTCGIEFLEISKATFDCEDVGENNVILTLTDFSGNSAVCSAIINIVDDEFPTITAPADIYSQTDFLQCDVSDLDLGTPNFHDNCSQLSLSNDAPEVFPIGETTVLWTITDAAGNESSDVQLVTLIDNPGNSISITPDGETTFCDGGEITLSASAGFDNYLWSNGAQTQNILVTDSGNYSVMGEYGNGCGAISSDTIYVDVLPDSDNDGTCDFEDNCPNDPNKTEPGVCGCGISDIDSDSDGVADCNDECPFQEIPIGSSCNDGNENTINDVVTADCQCVGTIVDGSIIGSAIWNSACGARDTQFDFYYVLNQTFAFTVNGLIEADGSFTLSDLEPGTYSILIKPESYLAVLIPNYELNSNSNTLDIGSFVPGDVSNDNFINLPDISLINASFGLTADDANYNSLADLNCDNVVNIVDVSLLNVSFGLQGDGLNP